MSVLTLSELKIKIIERAFVNALESYFEGT